MQTNLIISQTLAQAILNYLVERPFKDVAQLVQGLASLTPVEEKKEEK